MLSKEQIQKLYNEAITVRRRSYSPYSKFKVGASVLLSNGEIISGTNVENASYGLACCAERNALFATIAQGYKKEDIQGMLVLADTDGPCSPCGACRQVISELVDKDCPIILTNLKNDMLEIKVKDLLPFSFSKDDLNV